jgi:hypothetical protein
MHAFAPATLAAAVQALGMLQPGTDVPGAVPGRWLQLVLSHSQQQMQQESESAATAADGGSGVRQLHLQQQQQQQQQQQEEQQVVLSASDLSKMLWGLSELKVWPGKPWMDTWLQGE